MSSQNGVDTTDASFELDVMEASRTCLVVVDFWAAWCQPCRMLAPLLEQAVADFGDKVRLVKANTDETPEAAMQFGVQGIPAVFAVAGGEVVDQFTGVLPEAALREWMERNLQQFELRRAEQLLESDPAAAEKTLLDLKAVRSLQPQATLALAKLHHHQGNTQAAAAEIEELEKRGFLEPEAQALKTRLELATHESIDIETLKSAVESDPQNATQRLQLAEAYAVQGAFPEALEELLKTVQQGDADARESAREKMVDLFRIVEDEELVREYRKKLSMALY